MKKINFLTLLIFIASLTVSYANNDLKLIEAAKKGDLKQVQELLKKGAKINATEPEEGQTALMKAAGEGHLAVVKFLVEKGAKINQKDKDGWTALMEAVYGNYEDITKYLISKKANVNDKSTNDWKDKEKNITIPKGSSVLKIATIVKAKKEIIEALIKAGAK